MLWVNLNVCGIYDTIMHYIKMEAEGMKQDKNYDQIAEELTKRLSETKENKKKMEDAVKSAEILCIKFSNDPRALHEAMNVKQSCERALESIKDQIELLTQIIETIKTE